MAPGSIVQAAFGGGIFRGRRAPGDSVYDAVNALVNDERELFRRGGSTYKSNADASLTLKSLADLHTHAGQRTLFLGSGGFDSFYVLGTNDASPVSLPPGGNVPPGQVQPVTVGPLTIIPAIRGLGLDDFWDRLQLYAGARKTAAYTTGTASVTAGSKTVTGAGTSWSANVEKGSLITFTGLTVVGVVESVDSNTQITLAEAWAGSTLAGVAYSVDSVKSYSLTVSIPKNTPTFLGAVGSPARLLIAYNNIVRYSSPGLPLVMGEGDYHQLPTGSVITGVDAIEDTAVIFTTGGVWAISNMALDPLDDAGNVQHEVAQISNLILWGDPGIATYEGALIVPAIDDVYAFTLSGPPIPVSQGIRPLYREYVEAGYKPGIATVYRGHYFLPVLDGSDTVIDSLVCRLDLRETDGSRRPAWTRQANGAAGRAYATRVGATTRTPKLLGLDGLRVSDLTGIFDPDATRKDDADGTDHALTITGNDVDTGPGLRANTVLSANVEYELVDAASDNPTMAFATATGAEGSSFTTATALATGASTGPESDGTTPVAFDIRRKVERIRWRFQTSGAAASAILRRVELKIRPSGRQ